MQVPIPEGLQEMQSWQDSSGMHLLSQDNPQGSLRSADTPNSRGSVALPLATRALYFIRD